MIKKVLKLLAGVVVLLVAAVVALVVGARNPLPDVAPNEAGLALAREVLAAVAADQWQHTGAITWRFSDRNTHLWDRQRGLVMVTLSNGTTVMLDEARTRTFARDAQGQAVSSAALAEKAWKMWINDAFWMMGPAKLLDPGTSHAALTLEDGRQALLVRYASGGATPGDAYLWILGPDRLPVAWRTYVSVLPVAGLEFTWEDWVTLDTGPRVATSHKVLGAGQPMVTRLKAAATLSQLVPGPDPFAPLFGPDALTPGQAQPHSAPAAGP